MVLSLAVPTASSVALTQGSGLTLANHDSDFAEHRKNPQRRVRPPQRPWRDERRQETGQKTEASQRRS